MREKAPGAVLDQSDVPVDDTSTVSGAGVQSSTVLQVGEDSDQAPLDEGSSGHLTSDVAVKQTPSSHELLTIALQMAWYLRVNERAERKRPLTRQELGDAFDRNVAELAYIGQGQKGVLDRAAELAKVESGDPVTHWVRLGTSRASYSTLVAIGLSALALGGNFESTLPALWLTALFFVAGAYLDSYQAVYLKAESILKSATKYEGPRLGTVGKENDVDKRLQDTEKRMKKAAIAGITGAVILAVYVGFNAVREIERKEAEQNQTKAIIESVTRQSLPNQPR